MAKKKQKTEEKQPEPPKEIIPEELYTLVELVKMCPAEPSWIIYNLTRKGLLGQYEQELEDYDKKEIKPTISIKDFDDIINGKQ